jgi:hypothetical protein
MGRGIVVSTVVVEQRKSGAVLSAVRLSADAVRALSTGGAEIKVSHDGDGDQHAESRLPRVVAAKGSRQNANLRRSR